VRGSPNRITLPKEDDGGETRSRSDSSRIETAEADRCRPFLSHLRLGDARITLQAQVRNLRVLSELQRFLLNTHHGDTEARRIGKDSAANLLKGMRVKLNQTLRQFSIPANVSP
jgi:hypothetical protein